MLEEQQLPPEETVPPQPEEQLVPEEPDVEEPQPTEPTITEEQPIVNDSEEVVAVEENSVSVEPSPSNLKTFYEGSPEVNPNNPLLEHIGENYDTNKNKENQ